MNGMGARNSMAWALVLLAGCSGSSSNGSSNTTQTGTSGGTQETSTPVMDGGPGQGEAVASASDAGGAAVSQEVALPPMPTNVHGPASPWAQMSAHDKGHWMGEAVTPTMGELFRAYDANRFAHVRCATCHGDNARAVNFHMPNSLPALPMPGSDAWNQLTQRDPRIFHFMAERVVPTMSQVLGVEPFNMQTRQGFGCFNCHPHAP